MPDNIAVDLKALTPRDRLDYYVSQSDFVDVLFRHIAQGGLLPELADIWDVHYCDLYGYIKSKPDIDKRYAEACAARIEFFIDDLKKQLRSIASLDIRQIYASDGTIKPVEEWPSQLGLTVQSIEVNELWQGKGKDKEQIGITKKIKFWDKTKSIELLGKTLSMFVDRHEIKVTSLDDLISHSYIDVDAKKSE